MLEHASRDVVSIAPNDSVMVAFNVMIDEQVEHVPVLAEGELVGICTSTDLLKVRQDQREHERRQEGFDFGGMRNLFARRNGARSEAPSCAPGHYPAAASDRGRPTTGVTWVRAGAAPRDGARPAARAGAVRAASVPGERRAGRPHRTSAARAPPPRHDRPADRAVVPELQVLGHVTDGRVLRAAVTPDGEQQLVLRGRQPGGGRLRSRSSAGTGAARHETRAAAGTRHQSRTYRIRYVAS